MWHLASYSLILKYSAFGKQASLLGIANRASPRSFPMYYAMGTRQVIVARLPNYKTPSTKDNLDSLQGFFEFLKD